MVQCTGAMWNRCDLTCCIHTQKKHMQLAPCYTRCGAVCVPNSSGGVGHGKLVLHPNPCPLWCQQYLHHTAALYYYTGHSLFPPGHTHFSGSRCLPNTPWTRVWPTSTTCSTHPHNENMQGCPSRTVGLNLLNYATHVLLEMHKGTECTCVLSVL